MTYENPNCQVCGGTTILNPYEELVCIKCGELQKTQEIFNQSAKTGDKELPLPLQVAKSFQETNTFVTFSDTEEILLYQDGIYIKGGERFIKEKIQQTVSEDYVNKRLCEEVIGHIQRSTYTRRDEFDNDPSILVLKNCIFNLSTFETEPHTPNYLTQVKLDVTYDHNAECHTIKKFLQEVMYPEDIPVMQEYVGYCLWRNYEAQKAVMLVGDGGNGKSTIISIISSLLGIQNISTRSLQDLELNRFAKSSLYGKLANLYPDLSDVALKSTGTFKSLTGGDPVSAEYKFKNDFSFVNYAKFIFSCNKIPEVHDDTTAFFRRWIIFVFPNRFEGNKENKNLLKELTTAEEMSGFLNWAIEGLKRLKENNWVFSNSKSTEEIRDSYIRKSSPIQAFLADCIEVISDAYYPKQLLFAAFANYCRKHKLPVVTQDTFFKNLPQHVTISNSRRKWQDKEKVPCFNGIQLKDEFCSSLNESFSSNKMGKSLDTPDTLDTFVLENDPKDNPINPINGSSHLNTTKKGME